MPLFVILTLFPDVVEAYARSSILGLAQDKGLIRILPVDLRDFTRDRHRTVDDRPFGGGPGMLLKPEPIVEAVEWLEQRHGTFRKFALCPSGPVFSQSMAREFSGEQRLLFLCGRYEGFDERVRRLVAFEDLSLGDFVLAGGELAALAITESTARLVPGVLGHEESPLQDSFQQGETLDCPHYTRPRTWRGLEVPEVLLNGDHAAIERWRAAAARLKTAQRSSERSLNH